MINIELTKEQAKMLLIVTGSMAGTEGARGVYEMLRNKLRVIGDIPEPRIIHKYETFVVDDEMIEAVKTM